MGARAWPADHRTKADLSATAQGPVQEQLAAEMIKQAQVQGLALTGPDGLLGQLTKTVLETPTVCRTCYAVTSPRTCQRPS